MCIRRVKKPVALWIVMLCAIVFIATIAGTEFATERTMSADPDLSARLTDRHYGSMTVKDEYDYADTETELDIIGYIKTTDIFVNDDVWFDKDGNGSVDMSDVYANEDYVSQILVPEDSYYAIIDYDTNYYAVFADRASGINEEVVTVDVQVAANNNNAELASDVEFYYDNDNAILYLKKYLVDNPPVEGLRVQFVHITDDVNTMTKTMAFVTNFTCDDVKESVQEAVEGDVFTVNVLEALSGSVTFPYCSKTYLPCFSAVNMKMYINGMETETAFTFDEASGEISLDIDPFFTSFFVVEVSEVNDVNLLSAMLFATQDEEDVPLADEYWEDTVSSWEELPSSGLTLRFTSEPTVGSYQPMSWAYKAYVNTTSTNPVEVTDASLQLAHKSGDTVSAAQENLIKEFILDDMGMDGEVISTYSNQYSTGYTADTNIWTKSSSYYHWGTKTANAALNTLAYRHGISAGRVSSITSEDKSTYDSGNTILNYALNIIKGQGDYNTNLSNILSFLSSPPDELSLGGSTGFKYYNYSTWIYAGSGAAAGISDVADRRTKYDDYVDRYYCIVTGLSDGETLFNGTAEAVNGTKPIFLLHCCHVYEHIGDWDLGKTSSSATDMNGSLVILKIDEDSHTLYCGVLPKATNDTETTNNKYLQRCVAFTKVSYEYEKSGSITVNVYDKDTYARVGSCLYYLYTDKSCKTIAKDTNGNNLYFYSSSTASTTLEDVPFGTYYIKQANAVNGYLKDGDIHAVTISAGNKNGIVNIYLTKQYTTFTLTVKELKSKKKTLPGVKFELKNSSGSIISKSYNNLSFNLTSDSNGQIHFSLTPGTYTLTEISTITNFSYATTSGSSAKTITFTVGSDATGVARTVDGSGNSSNAYVHYEPLAYVSILSQVQDSTLKANTPSDWKQYKDSGLSASANVQTTGALFDLYTAEKITVGYDSSGNAITINSGTKLTLCDSSGNTTSGSSISDGHAKSYNSGGKAYIKAEYIKYNGTVYNIPAYKYTWKLVQASQGYTTVGYTNVTVDGTVWSTLNKNNKLGNYVASITDDPVIMKRQSITVDGFVKQYSTLNTTTTDASEILFVKDSDSTLYTCLSTDVSTSNASSMLIGCTKASTKLTSCDLTKGSVTPRTGGANSNCITQFINEKINAVTDKTSQTVSSSAAISNQTTYTYAYVYSNSSKISANSKETLYLDTSTNGKDMNFVYSLTKSVDAIIRLVANEKLVAMDGSIINEGTVLGYYCTQKVGSNTGEWSFTKIGSAQINNPFSSSSTTMPTIPAVSLGKNLDGTALPTGSYAIDVVLPSDDNMIEDIFKTLSFDSYWTAAKSTSSSFNTNVLVPLAKLNDYSFNGVAIIAPDPVTDTTPDDSPSEDADHSTGDTSSQADPYDPQNPDSSLLNDSDDMPIPSEDWIVDNRFNKTYRIVDTDSTTEGSATETVSDTLPTVFSYVVKDESNDYIGNYNEWTSRYKIFYYYEVLEVEAPTDFVEAVKNGTFDSYTNARKGQTNQWEYVYQVVDGETHYYRRFSVDGYTSYAKSLASTIVFNTNSPGYVTTTEATKDGVVTCSITDTTWLNSRLKLFNGEYFIGVGVLTIKSYTDPVTGATYSKEEFAMGRVTSDQYPLRIKTRQLFNLD